MATSGASTSRGDGIRGKVVDECGDVDERGESVAGDEVVDPPIALRRGEGAAAGEQAGKRVGRRRREERVVGDGDGADRRAVGPDHLHTVVRPDLDTLLPQEVDRAVQRLGHDRRVVDTDAEQHADVHGQLLGQGPVPRRDHGEHQLAAELGQQVLEKRHPRSGRRRVR
jgi:hypothetical protein